ncbi:MAG: hypothetical protein HS105_04440 [Chloracidobacterium sp.]|nr:hypothetical protein [Chloracidobacterium sp.]MCO5333026.1 hypothetical protein [Pyrinomonadaceae bacterium]
MTKLSRFACVILGFGVIILAASAVSAQKANDDAVPVMTEFRGIKIGMPAKDVENTIKKDAAAKDDKGFYFTFSEDEAAQVALDADNNVSAISAMYFKVDAATPKIGDVFGKAATAKPEADGHIYQMIRYPKAGYWISYNRTGGDSPMVTITMQKIPADEQ